MDKALMVLEARNILRTLEWSAKYSSCTGWPCCPICNGIKPGHGRNMLGELPDNQGHFKSCKLAKVLLKFGETERELNNERMELK